MHYTETMRYLYSNLPALLTGCDAAVELVNRMQQALQLSV
jgi:hypothetical protein